MIKINELNYNYDDLEPVMDKETVEIHHDKHHQAYANNLNALLEKTEYADWSLEKIVKNFQNIDQKLQNGILNNAGGVINHNLFFRQFSKNPQNKPTGDLENVIHTKFGNLENLLTELKAKGAKRFGSGWSFLVVQNGELEVIDAPNQNSPLLTNDNIIPILGIDVWEHSYYLKYQNKRPEYLDNIVKIIDWKVIEENYSDAKNNICKDIK